MTLPSIPDPRVMLPQTMAVLEQGIGEELHLGAQLYVSVEGEVAADTAAGEARPGVPMTPDTLMGWMSSGKPIGAVALAQLWEDGRLDLDDRVSRFIPEFGSKGKGAVTLRHLLTHTAGLPLVDPRWPDPSWDEVIARICDAELTPGWFPGRWAAYDSGSGWFLLGEVIRRLDGRPYDQYVREQIFLPLGLEDAWLALPPDRARAYGDRLGLLYATQSGTPRPVSHWESEAGFAFCRPGASARGPMRALGHFYEMLLFRGRRNGVDILSPQAVEALTAHHRVGLFDEVHRHIIDWGLGFVLDSKRYGEQTVPYGYGPHASTRAFGHSGSQSSAAFADPEFGLVVAVVTNGLPGEPRHQRRIRAILTAVYDDLGLAGS